MCSILILKKVSNSAFKTVKMTINCYFKANIRHSENKKREPRLSFERHITIQS